MSTPVLIRKKSALGYQLFAVCPGGLESALKKELIGLSVKITGEFPGGIAFEGNLETAYTACLALRTASRVLLLLEERNEVRSPDALYKSVLSVDWSRVFLPTSTFAVYVTESHTQRPNFPINLQFLALKAKDAIADFFNRRNGSRPNVDREDPDVTIRLHLHNHTLKIYYDLSGPSLHERGYRAQTGEAPLKENLAAGLLLLAGWDERSKEGQTFYDPFCGSGTLLIEAAMIATNTAPGLMRTHFGFYAWRDHQRKLFDDVRAKLLEKIIKDPAKISPIIGSDIDPKMIKIAQENIKNSNFESLIKLKILPFEMTEGLDSKGLMVCNPPYGVRMSEEQHLLPVYAAIGKTFKFKYKGWEAGVLSSSKNLLQSISLKPSHKYVLRNGSIETFFYTYTLF